MKKKTENQQWFEGFKCAEEQYKEGRIGTIPRYDEIVFESPLGGYCSYHGYDQFMIGMSDYIKFYENTLKEVLTRRS